MLDLLIWPLAGAAFGACLGYAVAAWRSDLGLAPPDFALSAGGVALAAAAFVSGWEGVCLIAALSALALADLRCRILPNELTYGLTAAGLVFALLGPRDIALAVIGAGLAAATLLSLRAAWLWAKKQEALGLGDVKMLAGVGAFFGPYALPEIVFWASVSGIAIALAMTLAGRRDPEIPFGAAIALAAWLYAACGPVLFAV